MLALSRSSSLYRCLLTFSSFTCCEDWRLVLCELLRLISRLLLLAGTDGNLQRGDFDMPRKRKQERNVTRRNSGARLGWSNFSCDTRSRYQKQFSSGLVGGVVSSTPRSSHATGTSPNTEQGFFFFFFFCFMSSPKSPKLQKMGKNMNFTKESKDKASKTQVIESSLPTVVQFPLCERASCFLPSGGFFSQPPGAIPVLLLRYP